MPEAKTIFAVARKPDDEFSIDSVNWALHKEELAIRRGLKTLWALRGSRGICIGKFWTVVSLSLVALGNYASWGTPYIQQYILCGRNLAVKNCKVCMFKTCKKTCKKKTANMRPKPPLSA
jgi:hypothetical protein